MLFRSATYPSQELLDKIVWQVATDADILTQTQYKFPIVFRSGKNKVEKNICYIFNYSAENKTIQNPYFAGKELLSGKKVEKNGEIVLKPWDVMILEEN